MRSSSNGPHIELLKQLDFRYILGCKPGDHTHLFEFIEESYKLESAEFSVTPLAANPQRA